MAEPGRTVKGVGIVNQLEAQPDAPRLSDVLFEKSAPSFASIAPLPSNVEAIEAALQFSAGKSDFVVLIGPSGWGKSHLMGAVEARLRQDGKETSRPLAAEKFLENQPRLASPAPLLLDDCQEVLSKTRNRAMLRLALEHRMRSCRPTLLSFTSAKITRPIRAFLPHPREWTICLIGNPEPEERQPLIHQMATADGLALSPNLVRVIAHQMHGNGRTLSGALKRLRLSGCTWLDNFATLRACGLLDPFFADNSSWDLKYRILRAAESSRPTLGSVSAADLAVYVMLRIASLSEADVARAADAEPAAVYLRACRFERELQKDTAKASAVRQFVDLVAGSLTQD